MNKITTHNQILRFVYNETSVDESSTLHTQMMIDGNLYEEFYYTKAIKRNLDGCELSPRIITQNKILAYAQY